jgi:hypothetical protein
VAAAPRNPYRPGSDDPVADRRLRRTAWLLGLLAVLFYVGFIAATALRS